MRRLIGDILKEGNIWSIKRVISIITFLFVILLGTFIVISDKILDRVVNQYAISVFDSLLLFLTALLGITEVGKKFLSKDTPQ